MYGYNAETDVGRTAAVLTSIQGIYLVAKALTYTEG